jgi:hypothetical protein
MRAAGSLLLFVFTLGCDEAAPTLARSGRGQALEAAVAEGRLGAADDVEATLCPEGQRNQGNGVCGALDVCAEGYVSDDSGRCSAWRTPASLPSPVTSTRFVGTARHVYSLCGFVGGDARPPVPAFANLGEDGMTSSWVGMNLAVEMPLGCAPVVVGNRMYALGGHRQSVTEDGTLADTSATGVSATIDEFGFLGGATEMPPSLWVPRSFGTAIVADNAVWVFGGSFQGVMVRSIERAPIVDGNALGAFETVGELDVGFIQPNVTAIRGQSNTFLIAATTMVDGQPAAILWRPNGVTRLPPPFAREGCHVVNDDEVVGLGMSAAGERSASTARMAMANWQNASAEPAARAAVDDAWERLGRYPHAGQPRVCTVVNGWVITASEDGRPSALTRMAPLTRVLSSKEGR